MHQTIMPPSPSTTSEQPAPAISPSADPPVAPGGATTVTRYVLAGLAAVLGLAVLTAVVMIILAKPAPDPVAISQAALDEATAKLRLSNWTRLEEGIAKEELERRILLLADAIRATNAFSSAVDKLDKTDPENAPLLARRDAYVARARFWRAGGTKLAFLRDNFAHWKFNPTLRDVFWTQQPLAEKFVELDLELQRTFARLKATTQPNETLPPGPPVRPQLFDPDESQTPPQPAATTPAAPPPK